MNYIKIINWFWNEVPYADGYRPLYGILFLAIVDGLNKNGWRQNTLMDYERITNKCKFSKEVYLNGRKWLMENKFIEFVPGINNMQMAGFSLGEAVGNPTGISTEMPVENPTGKLTSTLTGVSNECRSEILPVSLPNTKHKTNKRLNNKHTDVNIPFEIFWNLYQKKCGRQNAESLWNKLTDEERSLAIQHIPAYVLSTSDRQYRKNPETYLRNKSFNDEIIKSNGPTNGGYSAKKGNFKEQGFATVASELSESLWQLEGS